MSCVRPGCLCCAVAASRWWPLSEAPAPLAGARSGRSCERPWCTLRSRSSRDASTTCTGTTAGPQRAPVHARASQGELPRTPRAVLSQSHSISVPPRRRRDQTTQARRNLAATLARTGPPPTDMGRNNVHTEAAKRRQVHQSLRVDSLQHRRALHSRSARQRRVIGPDLTEQIIWFLLSNFQEYYPNNSC